jgi:hypothetical protein
MANDSKISDGVLEISPSDSLAGSEFVGVNISTYYKWWWEALIGTHMISLKCRPELRAPLQFEFDEALTMGCDLAIHRLLLTGSVEGKTYENFEITGKARCAYRF